ncbi:MAG: ester cyclase [Planktomarina sp.]|nr:ester cyclase [Planktomarina sp.]
MTPLALKSVIKPLQSAMMDFAELPVRSALNNLLTPKAKLQICYPFGELIGPESLYEGAYSQLFNSIPDLERRDIITMAGTTPEGQDWVGTMGNYMGTFVKPWLNIPATGHLTHMRFHEFFKIEDGAVSEMQAIWDIPEVMVQARAWPLAPQLGSFLCTPAPMTQDGLCISGNGDMALKRVLAMLTDLCRHPAEGGPEIMRLSTHWHSKFNWYGPTGIGTARGITGFRNWHQIPFLRGMPDRKLDAMGDLMSHWISEGNYVCETGWPNMRLTLSDDGWMGLPPVGKEVLMRSLDFWRVEDGLIRENWVLVDLLDIYQQLGLDVFLRLSEFNKAKSLANISLVNEPIT